jgi:hypothetical protein
LFCKCDGDDFFVVQEAVKRRLAGPNKQAATLQYEKISPSLRVASKNSVCGVANLDNGMTIVKIRVLQPSFFADNASCETSPTGS